jgi:hypothetical protein
MAPLPRQRTIVELEHAMLRTGTGTPDKRGLAHLTDEVVRPTRAARHLSELDLIER